MFEESRPFLLSLALGLVIGIERERSLAQREAHVPLGARTFTLIALIGTLAAHLESPPLAAALAILVGAVVLASYMKAMSGGAAIGATTEIAALATFGLGYMAHSEPRLTAMLGVIVVAVLALKPRIHEFAHEGLTPKEVSAALAFLVIAFVVLPLLPDRPIDPWGLCNPFRLWLLFVLIAGMGFGGYIAVRALGPERGLAAAGFFAGFVSSTAATLSYSQKARAQQGYEGPFAMAIVLANVASAAAQIVVVTLANPDMTPQAAAMIGAPVLVGVIGSLAARSLLKRMGYAKASAHATMVEGMRNPLEIGPAAKFALGLGVFLALAGFAARWFGPSAVLATAAVGGTVDVHAVTLGASTLARAGQIGTHDALLAILLAFLMNMVVKLVIVAWAGGRALLWRAAPPMLAMMAAGAVAFSAVYRAP